jgi:hypothetical protein
VELGLEKCRLFLWFRTITAMLVQESRELQTSSLLGHQSLKFR